MQPSTPCTYQLLKSIIKYYKIKTEQFHLKYTFPIRSHCNCIHTHIHQQITIYVFTHAKMFQLELFRYSLLIWRCTDHLSVQSKRNDIFSRMPTYKYTGRKRDAIYLHYHVCIRIQMRRQYVHVIRNKKKTLQGQLPFFFKNRLEAYWLTTASHSVVIASLSIYTVRVWKRECEC